jgi:hypothetical protein
MRVIFFFTVVFGVYFTANAYVFWLLWDALEALPALRPLVAAVFWLSAVVFILARVLEARVPPKVIDIFVWYGSVWLAALTYFFFLALIINIAQLLLIALGYRPDLWPVAYPILKLWLLGAVLAVTGATVAYGMWNARHPVVRTIVRTVHKEGGARAAWRIVLATDIHLGTIVNRSRAEALVRSVNAQEPDLVLLGGDVLDEDEGPVLRRDIGSVLAEIKAPYGVYAIPGNHEYIGGIDRALAYLADHGITILRDQAVLVGGSFYLVGRDDVSGTRFGGTPRKALAALLEGLDTSRPVVVLDHEPVGLSAVAADGRVDVQLSGHTHHGQLWPFNYITSLVYEQSWGERTIGDTFFYVSSGWGTWGPPVRVGNTPELVVFQLNFDSPVLSNDRM